MGRGRSGRVALMPRRDIERKPLEETRVEETRREEPVRRDEEYQEFKDMPSRSTEFAYSGTGKETVDFFNKNSNYDELIRGMTRSQLESFNAWMRGHFMNGQQYNGWDAMDREDRNLTRDFDNVLDRARLDKGIVVRRLTTAELLLGKGNRVPRSLAQLQALKGRTVLSTGSMSTGAAAHGLGIGSESRKKVELVIKIPGGTTGAGMWIGDKRIGFHGAGQREFMTNRDIFFTVGNTTYNNRTGKYEVELIYAGRQAHDYGRRRRL